MYALLFLAFCTGFGGLLFELICLRRASLLLGGGSPALAIVVAAFLLGLGLGGRLLARMRAVQKTPLRSARLFYAGLSALLPATYFILDALGPGQGALAGTLCFALPLMSSILMGLAFPLLFPLIMHAAGPKGCGLLQGVNLLGSVLGAAAGAVWLIPAHGLWASAWIASGAYAVAVLASFFTRLGFVSGSESPSPAKRLLAGGRSGKILLATGFATLGLQLWLPRRLGFFLGSFLPTLSGTLIAILLGLAAGSLLCSLLSAFLGRSRRSLSLPWLACAGGIGTGIAMLLVEGFGPVLAGWSLESPWQGLALASLAPFALLAPATVMIGACLPTAIMQARENGALSARDVGQAFFLFSIGAALGAFLLPFGFGMPDALYLMPLICGVVLLAAAGRPVLLAVGIVFLASCFLWQRGEPLLRGARGVDLGPVRMTILAERSDRITSACVVQDRVNGERILYTEAFSAAGGESSTYMRALGLLPMMLGPAKGELCVICLGTGTTAGAMARSAGRRTLHLVEISRAVWHLSKYFAESRAAWNAAPGLELHLADGRQFLEGQSAGSLAAVTLEPLLPQAPGSVHLYSKEFYTAAHEALMPSGLCVQWLPTHALGRDDFLSLAKSFAHVFAELELYLVDNASILIGRKGGKAARTPVQLSHGKDAFLTGLWSEEDLALAQLPLAVDRLRKAKVPLVLDDRPFLETRAYASARKKAAWLEENLRLLLSWFPEAEADSNDSLNEARKLRLLARMQIARRSSDPNSDGYAFAVRMLGQALEMWPRSSLLQLEYEGAVALLETEQAMRSLARSRLRDCLEHVERALAHGAVRPEVLAARACALFRLGKKKAARVVVQELARFHSEYKLLPKIAMRAGSSLAALFDEAELQVPDDVSASSKELSFQAARENFAVDYAAGKAWARTFRLRKPRVAEWYVLDAVRRGKLSGLDALQSFVETLDQAGLSLLRGPASMRPELARVLLRKLPGRLPLPNWLRALASGSEEDKIALLAGLERRKSHANLMLVLDLLEQEAQTAAVLLPAFGLLLRWRPDAKFYRPDLVAVERREKVRAFRRKILAEQGR